MTQCKPKVGTDAVKSMIWPFWLQVCDVLFIPFIVWWGLTPTNVLNSNPYWKALERVGCGGAALLFFTGILFGVIGLVQARKMSRLRIGTSVLAVVNICAGAFLLALLVLIILAVGKGAA